ncbi:MAG TPA: Fur family transcriptional regulator [Candidatus Dormibacteraeota bacterium]|nr:Fur family transcriptional regulator [Candidatus Dormibacteraeota bacterium]
MSGLETIRAQGRRLTPQRRLVYQALLDHPGHATADDLCASIARRLPGVQRTTVYRTLDLLVELGMARTLRLGRSTSYEPVRAGAESHQHLMCDQCGATADVGFPDLTDRVQDAARTLGFAIDRIDLVGHGRCLACTRTAAIA